MKKISSKNFWLAVTCALLFSTSTWMVVWLKESFTPFGQLTIRATVALIVSFIWVLIVDRKIDFDISKYNKKLLFLELFCRPAFNFCFIMAATSVNGTMALMVLLFVKMLTNVIFSSIKVHQFPGHVELFGYIAVTAGILCYGWGVEGIFTLGLLWAVASGFFEGLRLELIDKLSIDDKDTPKLAMIEFSGMLFVVLVALFISGGGFFITSPLALTVHSLWGIVLAVLAVVILGLDYYLSPRISTGIYSAILATEVGFAGVVNMVFLGTPLGLQQIVGLFISIAAIVLIKTAVPKKALEN